MEKIILTLSLIISIVCLIIIFRVKPIKEWLLSFLFTAYFANIIGTMVVKFKLIKYLKLGSYINAGQFFELLIFPVIVTYFYKTSYHSTLIKMIFQCMLYSVGLTIIEVTLEKNTNIIKYLNWHWTYSLLSFVSFMLFVRFILKYINSKTNN